MSKLPEILQRTSKIVMLHMNFRNRAEEQGDFPSLPTYHLKAPSTLSASGATILRPPTTKLLLAEGEIAVIIGKTARRVPVDRAWEYVGYVAPANDVTVMDFSWAESPAMLRAKGWDGSTPIGPLVDARAVDPGRLHLRLSVNGEVRQEATSDQLIFPLAQLVAELSEVMTLLPGDVILSGTPANARPVEPGDIVVVELVGLSRLENVVAEDTATLSPLMPQPRTIPRVRAVSRGLAAHRDVILKPEELATLRSMNWEQLRNAAQREGLALDKLSGIAQIATASPIAGHVYTIRQVPHRDRILDGMIKRCHEALFAVGRDEVILAEGTFALADRELIDRLAARECEGVIMGGGTAAPAGRLATYAAVSKPPSRSSPILTNTPIAIADQLVAPGDIAVAGAWGAAVLPSGIAAAIARRPAVA